MKKGKNNGFIAISMIYSVFILFVTILIATMFSYISDRKSANIIKDDIKNNFYTKLPEISTTDSFSQYGAIGYNVKVDVTPGSFPVSGIKYIWSQITSGVPNKSINNGDTTFLSFADNPSGDYYLIVKACDVFDNCTVAISKKYTIQEDAVLVAGSTFKTKLTNLSGGNPIYSFARTYTIPEEAMQSSNLISTDSSAFPVYAYCTTNDDNKSDCFYYTEANHVKFNVNSSNMFSGMADLYTVDLGDFDRSLVTNTSGMFSGCTALHYINTPLRHATTPQIPLPHDFYTDEGAKITSISGMMTPQVWISSERYEDYIITYDLDGGNLSQNNPVTYNRNTETFILNNPVREGYTFAGWSGGKNLYNASVAEPNDGVQTYADTIIFDEGFVDGNYGRGIKVQTYLSSNAGGTATNILNFNSIQSYGRAQKTFTKNSSFDRIQLKMDTFKKDPTYELYRVGLANGKTYTISFNIDQYDQNRTYAEISNLQIELGNRPTAFEHYVSKELTVRIPKGSTGNRSYKANWIKNDESYYTLRINPNGGSWEGNTGIVTRKISYSEVYDIPIPTKEGYVFDGWKELKGTLLSNHQFDTTYVYNNKSTSKETVVHDVITKLYDNPLSSTEKELKITNLGGKNTAPGLGGFYSTPVSAKVNSKYVHVFVAKLPAGHYFQYAHNALGTGSSVRWLTSNAGTGNYQTYAYEVTTGSAGLATPHAFSHVFMTKNINNTWDNWSEESGAATAYVAYSNIFDITRDNAGIGQIDGTATLTATWTAPRKLTINPNGGTYNGDTTNLTITKGKNQYVSLSNNLSKPGYIFNGWDYSGNGMVNYYNQDNRSPYITTSDIDYFTSTSNTPAAPYFNTSSNGGTVTTSIATDPSGNYAMKIVTNGTVGPAAGGFATHQYETVPERVNVIVMNANIPKGYKVKVAGVSRMYTGIGSAQQSSKLFDGTYDDVGTGSYKTYYIPVYFGKTGYFFSDVYVYLDGSAAGKSNTSVTWYVKSIRTLSFDKKNLISHFKFANEDTTLTARWGTGGSKVNFVPNGGSFDSNYVYNWGNDYFLSAGETMRFYYYNQSYGPDKIPSGYNWTPDVRVTTKSGYRLIGWYTQASGGTKVFEGDGSLVPNVAGYSDANSRWIKYDSNVTLYAHWAKRYYVNLETDSRSNATISASSNWTSVTTGFGYKTVGRNYIQGEPFGDLPTATAPGCTFNGWYTVGDVDGGRGFTIESSTAAWNYKAIKYSLIPGATYRITMDKAEITKGSGTQFEARIYDFDDSSSLVVKKINFGTNIDFELEVPASANMQHRLAILLYAGIGGQTANKEVKFTRIKIGTLAEGNGNKRTIKSTDIFNDSRNIQLIGGWTCS